jgi:hypothetical protein
MLRHPAYRDDESIQVAAYMRAIAAKVDGQLPPEAPELWLGRPRWPLRRSVGNIEFSLDFIALLLVGESSHGTGGESSE